MAIGHAKTFSTPPKGAFALEDLLEKVKMYLLSTKKRKKVSPMVRRCGNNRPKPQKEVLCVSKNKTDKEKKFGIY